MTMIIMFMLMRMGCTHTNLSGFLNEPVYNIHMKPFKYPSEEKKGCWPVALALAVWWGAVAVLIWFLAR